MHRRNLTKNRDDTTPIYLQICILLFINTAKLFVKVTKICKDTVAYNK